MSGRVRPLDLVLRGVNRISGPIRQVNKDIESMLKPIRRVQNAAGQLGKELGLPKIGGAFKRVGQEVQGLGRTLLFGSVGAAAMAAGLGRFIDHADDIGALAKQYNVTTDALQEMRYAGQLLDVDQEKVDQGLKTFTKSVADMARGSGRAKFAFEKLGISVTKNGRIRPQIELMDEFADKLAKVKDPALQARYALAAFGSTDFVGLLRGGSAELQRFRAEAHALGYVLDQETIENAGKADDELRRLKVSVQGLGYGIASELLPEIQTIAKEMREWLQNPDNREMLQKQLVPAVKNLATGLGALSLFMLKLMSTTTGTIAVFGGFAAVLFGPAALAVGKLGFAFGGLAYKLLKIPIGLNSVMDVMKGLAKQVIPLLASAFRMLGFAIAANPIGATIVGLTALAALGVYLYKTYKPFRDLVDGLWANIKKGGWVSFLGPLGALGRWLYTTWKPFANLVDGVIERARQAGGVVARWVGLGGEKAQDQPASGKATALPITARAQPRDAVGPPVRVGGQIGISVGVEQGATARVRNVESESRQVPLSTGAVMAY